MMTPSKPNREQALADYTDSLLAQPTHPPPKRTPEDTEWPFDDDDAQDAETVQRLARIIRPDVGPDAAFRQRLAATLESEFAQSAPPQRQVLPFYRRPSVLRRVAAVLLVLLLGGVVVVLGDAASTEGSLGTALGDAFGIILVSVVGLIAVIGFLLWQRNH